MKHPTLDTNTKKKSIIKWLYFTQKIFISSPKHTVNFLILFLLFVYFHHNISITSGKYYVFGGAMKYNRKKKKTTDLV